MNGGNIAWAYGPFSCGFFTDLRIFRSNLRNKLFPNEKVFAEQVYRVSNCSRDKAMDGLVDFKFIQAQHKATNKRLK